MPSEKAPNLTRRHLQGTTLARELPENVAHAKLGCIFVTCVHFQRIESPNVSSNRRMTARPSLLRVNRLGEKIDYHKAYVRSGWLTVWRLADRDGVESDRLCRFANSVSTQTQAVRPFVTDVEVTSVATKTHL